MSVLGLGELAGEDFWQRLPLVIWVLNIHSAQRADLGLLVSHLLAEKSKAVAHESIFVFPPSSLETFPELYFSTLTYISGDDFSFLCCLFFFFSPSKEGRLQNLWVPPASAGVSLPPCPLLHGKKRHHVPRSHPGGKRPLDLFCLQAQGMLWKFQSHKEKSNSY